MLSLSIFIENVFKNIFPRQLSSDHTHLFSHKSIQYIFNTYGLISVAKWHFGTDSMDLRRSMITELLLNKTSTKGIEIFQEEYFSKEMMNSFQEIIDQQFAGSEIHILAKKIT